MEIARILINWLIVCMLIIFSIGLFYTVKEMVDEHLADKRREQRRQFMNSLFEEYPNRRKDDMK